MKQNEKNSAPSNVVNRTELAALTGAALTTIDAWVRQGCPFIQKGAGRGQEWKFNSADVIAWLRQRDVEQATGKVEADEAQLRKRKMVADTIAAELAVAKAKGELAPLDQVERMVGRAFAEVRAGMLQLPARLVTRLIGETNEATFKLVMREEITQVLEALSNATLVDAEENEPGAADD